MTRKRSREDDLDALDSSPTPSAPRSPPLRLSLADEILARHDDPGALSLACPWLNDQRLVERAGRGLLTPLELIRLLPLDTIRAQGIPLALWHSTPPTLDDDASQNSRRETFASAFISRDVLLEAWHNYLAIAIEGEYQPAAALVRLFIGRWKQFKTLGRRHGWPGLVRLLHDQQDENFIGRITLACHGWMDLGIAAPDSQWTQSHRASGHRMEPKDPA